MQHLPLPWVADRMPYLAEWAGMALEDTAAYLQYKKDNCLNAAAKVLQAIYRDHLLRCRYLVLHKLFLDSKKDSYVAPHMHTTHAHHTCTSHALLS
jgi:hypothetical protein